MKIFHSKPTIGKEELKAASNAILSGNVASSMQTELFEKELAGFINVKHSVSVSSGSAGLYLALYALDVKKGDEVIIPSYVCSAVLNAVMLIGAAPVLADSCIVHSNISPVDINKKITKRTKAIIVPHLFGLPANLKEILKTGIPVIEDCAQSIGAKYKGKFTGSFGELSVFSFYATKLLTTGEGGMVLSNNKRLIGKIRDFINYDEKPAFSKGFNLKITDIQSAIGRIQLKKLKSFIKARKKIAGLYDKALYRKNVALPQNLPEREHIYFRYVLGNVKQLDKKITAFKKAGINVRKPIFMPLCRYMGTKGISSSEKLWKSSLSIPIYPSLKSFEIQRIVNALKKIL